MAYIINKSDGSVLTTVADGVFDTSSSSLVLIGRRAVSYGEYFAENFVKLLENFASPTAPTAPLQGQIWFDTGTNALKVRTTISNTSTWNTFATFSANGTSVTGNQLISTATAPTAPLVVSSNVKVVNLNADLLDGYDTSTAATPSTIAVRNGSADLYANLFQGTATSARYADVAERFAASENLEPGDVVDIGGTNEITKTTADSHSVLGVISTAPAFRMNEDAGNDITHPFVAFVGRVPCKVIGRVKKGDYLVPSDMPGVAKSAPVTEVKWTFVGRALEDKDSDGVEKIMVVVGVK